MQSLPAAVWKLKSVFHHRERQGRRLPRFRQSQAVRCSILLPLLVAAMPLAGCLPLPTPGSGPGDAQDPCIETHDQGCVSDAEYQELADAIAEPLRETSSFENQWGLSTIRADQAYANLELLHGPDVAPGEGVTVGVLDTGIDAAHFQFRNRNIIQRFLPGSVGDDGSEFSHGTAVASIIAGEDDPDFPFDSHGVAWGADLVFFALPLGDPSDTYDPVTVDDLPGVDDFLLEYVGETLDWRHGGQGIDFLNMSLGVSGLIENFSEADLRTHVAAGLAKLAQEDSEDKVLLIWAAGNANGLSCVIDVPECVNGEVEASSAGLTAGLTAWIPELREHSVAVVAVGPEDGEITDFSNRCGIAAEQCIAAPGQAVRVAYFGPDGDGNPGARGTARFNGTSFAAPMVTGGLALMKHYFRDQISNTDLLARLLKTANRSGRYADATIYGRGLMDLGAATSPVGTTMVAMGNLVNGPGLAIGSTGLQLGTAFGDGLSQSLAGQEIAAFDALGAPFWYDFGELAPVAAAPSLSGRLREFQQLAVSAPNISVADGISFPLLSSSDSTATAPLSMRLVVSETSTASGSSHLSFAGSSLLATMPVTAGLTATAITTEGVTGQNPASGATLAWRMPESLLGLRVGWMGERQTLLGTVPDGAFGSLTSNAVFAGIEADGNLGAWHLGATAEIGSVNPRSRDGLLEDVSGIATSAFALHAIRPAADGSAFRVSLSQPLRVERGHALLAVPSGRTKSGEVVRNLLDIGLEPSGRQMDLSLQWRRPLDIGQLLLGATLSHEPGHRRNASSEVIVLSNWRIPF